MDDLNDERRAIARLKRGDIRSLDVLVLRHQTKALRTAYLITSDLETARDLVQSVFLSLCDSIRQYDAQRPFEPWLLRCVANTAIQVARRNSSQVSLDADISEDSGTFSESLPDMGPALDETVESSELREAVWQAINTLSPEQRAVIILRYYADLSEDEMTAALNCPPGTIKWRLHAARKQLRVLLRHFSNEMSE